jgi:radical SAM protein with 4Fe4S-binding SPASM domain
LREGLISKDLGEMFSLKSHYCMVTAPECNVLIDSTGKLFACDAMPENMRYGDVRTGIEPEKWRKVASICDVREECRECVSLPQCTEFDRCPSRVGYPDCRKQEERKLKSDLKFAYEIAQSAK